MSFTENSKYLKTEAIGGGVLFLAAVAGFLLNNSIFSPYYDAFTGFPLGFSIGSFSFSKPFLFWINDGLVSIFFFLIGLEIKNLIYAEDLSIQAQLAAPFSAAIAGVIVPALIYTLFNYDNHINMRGWAIPTAMDTAFILGIIALFNKSISSNLKFFIMCLSIIDDIIAVLVIAIFYAEELSSLAIIGSVSILGILALLNQSGVRHVFPYVLLGLVLWIFVLGSGVHTSIAGILLALTIPIDSENRNRCLLIRLRNYLHPWVAFVILPLFVFANTGLDLTDLSIEKILSPLSLGIILGLFLGKQLGVFGVIAILVKYNAIQLPSKTSWWQMYGVSVLCGVGFTMSLFIGILAFESGGPDYDDIIKSAVFIGSLISAVLGSVILLYRQKISHEN